MPKQSGFTLIELLVVIIILGILSAIALPSFLGQVSKGRQIEATKTLGDIRTKQIERRSEGSAFETTNLEALGVEERETYYKYDVEPFRDDGVAVFATPLKKWRATLKSYLVAIISFDGAIFSVTCESIALPGERLTRSNLDINSKAKTIICKNKAAIAK